MNPKDEARFLALLHQHGAILHKVAFGYCRNREDRVDLVQDMAVQLWRSFGRYDGRAKFSTWAYRVAMNVAISHFRGERRRIRGTLPVDELAEQLTANDPLTEAAGDNMQLLRRLIDALDELNRALVLLYLEGHSSEEIAEVVGISPANRVATANGCPSPPSCGTSPIPSPAATSPPRANTWKSYAASAAARSRRKATIRI
jgi:RNA polymerase sigma-70 factor (ECF subfamily)